MHCLFYIACFFLALQAALAVPTLAPRAEQSADAKGQSDQKCWFGCGGWGLGYGFGGNGLFGGLGYGPWGVGYGGAYLLNPYSSLYGPGWGLWKKDAAAPNQNSSVCLSPLVSLANNHTRYSPSSRASPCAGLSLFLEHPHLCSGESSYIGMDFGRSGPEETVVSSGWLSCS